MTNREMLSALGLYVYEHYAPSGSGETVGFTVQPITVKPDAAGIVTVRLESGESEEEALGRLVVAAEVALAESA